MSIKMEQERKRQVIAFSEKKPTNTKFRITVEPLGFLFIMAFFMQIIINQNLFLDKVCRVNFNFNSSICDAKHNNNNNNLTTNSSVKINPSIVNRIQSYVSVLNIYASIISNVPPVLVVLFLGPWSDRHGRKPIMCIPIIGVILSTLIYILNYLEDAWPAEYILLANVLVGCLGGVHTLVMAMNSYIADVTNEENRTLRLAILTGTIIIAIPLANFLSAFLYNFGGYLAVWCTSLGFALLALYYVFVFITDSKGPNREKRVGPFIKRVLFDQNKVAFVEDDDDQVQVEKQADQQQHLNTRFSLFSELKNLWKCFTVTFRARIGRERACLCLLLLAMCVMLFSNASHGITFLYVKKKFGWDVTQFSLFLAGDTLIAAMGAFVILPIMTKCLKIRDTIIGIVSLGGHIFSNLMMAFAVSPQFMYSSSVGLFLAPGIQVAIRSLLSKIAGKEDLTYVYSVVACLEAIIPLLASPTFNLLYIATLNSFLGASFVFESCLQSLVAILFLVILCLQSRDAQMVTAIRPVSRQPTISSIKFD